MWRPHLGEARVVAIGCGREQTYAINSEGFVYAWGRIACKPMPDLEVLAQDVAQPFQLPSTYLPTVCRYSATSRIEAGLTVAWNSWRSAAFIGLDPVTVPAQASGPGGTPRNGQAPSAALMKKLSQATAMDQDACAVVLSPPPRLKKHRAAVPSTAPAALAPPQLEALREERRVLLERLEAHRRKQSNQTRRTADWRARRLAERRLREGRLSDQFAADLVGEEHRCAVRTATWQRRARACTSPSVRYGWVRPGWMYWFPRCGGGGGGGRRRA